MQKCKLNFLLRFGLISILLGLFVTQSFAQNVTITGVVKDQSGELSRPDFGWLCIKKILL